MLISSKITNGINGNIEIPGDKSISHRSVIIPSIANGITEVSNILLSQDVINTINALKLLGVKIEKNKDKLIIEGNGLNSLKESKKNIYLGNSGTSARLLTGLLSSQSFNSTLVGDKSLSKRPMKRITEPLQLMGAKFESNNNMLPLKIFGQKLSNIDYDLKLPSAQVKSGIMLAALKTKGPTIINENKITRNHTEIMLDYFDADIQINNEDNNNIISIRGNKELLAKNISVPSDLSSAAFFIVAALINNNSYINIKNVNLNPTRDGILKALDIMQANIAVKNTKTINGEKIGDLEVKSSKLKGCELNKEFAKLMIDEYPILSIAAAFADSPSIFRGLGELKVKESNRLELISFNLNQCGIFSKIEGEDLYIDPTTKKNFINNKIKTDEDHRIAMSFAIMGTRLGSDLEILNSEFIKTSFPNFVKLLNISGGILNE